MMMMMMATGHVASVPHGWWLRRWVGGDMDGAAWQQLWGYRPGGGGGGVAAAAWP